MSDIQDLIKRIGVPDEDENASKKLGVCPKCGKKRIDSKKLDGGMYVERTCRACGYKWTVRNVSAGIPMRRKPVLPITRIPEGLRTDEPATSISGRLEED